MRDDDARVANTGRPGGWMHLVERHSIDHDVPADLASARTKENQTPMPAVSADTSAVARSARDRESTRDGIHRPAARSG